MPGGSHTSHTAAQDPALEDAQSHFCCILPLDREGGCISMSRCHMGYVGVTAFGRHNLLP